MRKGFLLSSPNPKTNTTPKPKPSSSSSLQTPKKPYPTIEVDPSDRLTSLPDPILHQILSHLPIDDLVRTSVLARRWAHLWTFSPVLDFANFSSLFIECELYPSIVDRCLPQISSSDAILSLRFPLHREPDSLAASLDRWVRFAAAHSVQHLAFRAFYGGRIFHKMPPSLFHCRSLTDLKLSRCEITSAVPSGCCFPCLKTLVLCFVNVCDGPLDALLSGCPNVESLSLSKLYEISRLVVRAPVLEHLMVCDCIGLRRVELVEASELRRLMYSGDIEGIRIGKELVKLEEVAMLATHRSPFKNDERQWKRLVEAIAHARVLSINNWLFKFPLASGNQAIIFKNLKEIHWWPVYMNCPELPVEPWCPRRISKNSLCSLFSLLNACPTLEHLCIKGTYSLESEDDEDGLLEFDMLSLIDKYCSRGLQYPTFIDAGCGLPCLRTVNFTEFSGRKEEMQLLAFIANYAAALESVSLHYVYDITSRLSGIARVVNNFHKASPQACVFFEEFDDDKQCPKHEYMWYAHMIL